MKHYFLVSTAITYKLKDSEQRKEPIADIFPFIFNLEVPPTFNKKTLQKIELASVKTYFEENKIEESELDWSKSQLISLSYLGEMEEFDPKSKKETLN